MNNLRTNYTPGELIKSADFNDVTTAINNLQNAQETFATVIWVLNQLNNAGQGSLDAYTKTDDLASVAISGSYNDLEDKPEIPTSLPAADVYSYALTAEATSDTTEYADVF